MLTQLTKNVKKGQVRVKIKTTHGDMSFKLFKKDIPKEVENKAVNVRTFGSHDQKEESFAEFKENILKEINERLIEKNA